MSYPTCARAGVLWLTVLTVGGTSCGGGSGDVTGPPPAPTLATISVAPNSPPALQPGATQQFTAQGQTASGGVIRIDPVWSVVAGGGTINSTSGLFIAGTVPGTYVNTVVASSGTVTSSTTIVVVAGPAASMAANGGNNQSVLAGTAVPIAPSVKVADAYGNPVSGVPVTFLVTSGGGSVNGPAATTDASGVATVGAWTLGAAAVGNALTASSPGLTGSPITFTATGTAGAATTIALNAGNNQTATVGTAVALAPSVKVTDAKGNSVAGAVVSFVVTSGGGSVSAATATTDAAGVATVGGWTLGPSTGRNTVTASSAGLTGSPITFTATGTAGAAATIARNAGNNQVTGAGTRVPVAPSVTVTDTHGNPVAGVAVSFVTTSGGGSVTGATPTTDATGVATVGGWTLGASAGGNTLAASASGLIGSPVTFSATGTGPDLVAPTIVSVNITPAIANVSSSPQTVTVTVRATDGASGIADMKVSFVSPAATTASCSSSLLVSGTKADGTFSCTVTIPMNAAPGDWTVSLLAVDDAVKNLRSLHQSDLVAAGFPAKFAVVSATPDLTPPAIVSMSITPGAVDASSRAQTVTVTAHATDAISGIAFMTIGFISPASTSVSCSTSTLASGTKADGTLSCSVTIPIGAASGDWAVAYLAVDDGVTNRDLMQPADLAAAGFPTKITVTSSSADPTPPAIVSLSIAPSTVDVTSGAQTVTITVHATDAGSGIAFMTVGVISPTSTSAACSTSVLASGTKADGTLSCSVTIPMGAAPGDWLVGVLAVDDAVSNRTSMQQADIVAAGFPNKFTVVSR